MTDRLVLVSASPRVAPGVLTLAAWEALRSGPVCCADPEHPQLPALAATGIEVALLAGVRDRGGEAALAAAFRARAAGGGTAV
ncbi:MAG TPA: nucleoside triphosphate pyrophosphohydrolase, partial [Frankiaceae bacterium]|nr:nucleoside triphosphate pyrophosphohydrolase [Frankiaceae bacterium]